MVYSVVRIGRFMIKKLENERKKNGFIKSVENIAEILVAFLVEIIVENRREKDPIITPRSHPQEHNILLQG